MRYSIALASEVDSWQWVKRAEELGFHAAWFYDTQLLNPDVFICMALAAKETQRIRLGTGVVVPSNRIEPVTANALVSLNKLAPGRIDFGVGTGFTARRTMGLGAISLAKTGTYVERVRALTRGEMVEWDFEGHDRKIRFLNPELGLINVEDEIPVWLSAFGPKSQQLTAALGAGWLNFTGMGNAVSSLEAMRATWIAQGHEAGALNSALFFLGAVLEGKDETADNEKLFKQAGPGAAVTMHNFSDEGGAMGGAQLQGPLADLHAEYMKIHAGYEPEDAKYLSNHRGHLMFVREDEAPLYTPEFIRAASMSGTFDELVSNMRILKEAGYSQVVIQLVHGQEAAIEEWAEVFKAI